MFNIAKKIDSILKEKDLTRKELSRLVKCTAGALNQMIRGDRSFSDNIIKKLLPILEISREEFESWILTDKYSKEILELAIQVKKNFPYKRKSIVTCKIDEILQQKGISRTALSKLIDYNQSGLNRMITGKINISKPVLEKLSTALEISQDEILAWGLANKYSLEILELAVNNNELVNYKASS